jgi:hypothetical protein
MVAGVTAEAPEEAQEQETTARRSCGRGARKDRAGVQTFSTLTEAGMGTISITKWVCDRCGVTADARPAFPETGTRSVRVSLDFGLSGGPEIDWPEMCATCDDEVNAEVAAMQASAAAARQAITDAARETAAALESLMSQQVAVRASFD